MSNAAQNAKNFLTLNNSATLSTISVAHKSYPFGSVVPYDIDHAGRIIIFISLLSEHYKNLAADSRASIFVVDPFGVRDPQSHARATALLCFSQVPADEKETVEQSYFARFPESPGRSLVHDFVFFRGEPERIRWIGGFGEIRWIEGGKYRSTEFDHVSYNGMSMIEHMNDDHADALKDLAAAQAGGGQPLVRCSMVSIDGGGFQIALETSEKKKVVDVKFPERITNPPDVRAAMIALVESARKARSEK